LREKHRR